jgi:hypothetical protein
MFPSPILRSQTEEKIIRWDSRHLEHKLIAVQDSRDRVGAHVI